MSLRKEMLQVARLARNPLHDVTDLVVNFVLSQQHESGAFCNRAGEPDVYYTVFGLECLHAMSHDVDDEKVASYLRTLGEGRETDLVHLCCIARCWSNLKPTLWNQENRLAIKSQFEEFRTPDGGYSNLRGSSKGTVYHSFMGVTGYQDCLDEVPNPQGVLDCLNLLKTDDGAYANEVGMTLGTTTSSAAAESLLRFLGAPRSHELIEWLIGRIHSKGGFLAMPEAPMPDLLSTATALHALAGLKFDLSPIKEHCLDFIDTLWNGRGGFHGHWADDHLDCEYTYYGLLALGHLSL